MLERSLKVELSIAGQACGSQTLTESIVECRSQASIATDRCGTGVTRAVASDQLGNTGPLIWLAFAAIGSGAIHLDRGDAGCMTRALAAALSAAAAFTRHTGEASQGPVAVFAIPRC